MVLKVNDTFFTFTLCGIREDWAIIDLRVKNEYFNYDKSYSEILECSDFKNIQWLLKTALENYPYDRKLEFCEPDLEFRYHTSIDFNEPSIEVIINLKDERGYYTEEYYSLTLNINQISEFKNYIDEIINENEELHHFIR